MHLGFPLTGLRLGRSGGIETYAINIVHSLQKVEHSNEYLIFCSPENETLFPITNPNFKKVLQDRHRNIKAVKEKLTVPVEKIYEFMSNTKYLKKFNAPIQNAVSTIARCFFNVNDGIDKDIACDILHYMFHVLPLGQRFEIPLVLTVHDIQHEFFPEFFSQVEFKRRKDSYQPSAEKAHSIIAISNFTKKTYIEKLGISPEKIFVVYNGYNENFKPLNREKVETLRVKYNLPERFLLYPSATWVHKNHLNLIRAYKILKERYRFKDKLIFIGIKKENHSVIKKEIERLQLSDSVIDLGYLPYEDLPLLYNAASLLVFPSLFEGFGIPVVEAMAVGLPVTCSNTTSLPEVAGDAALFFDPNLPEDIAEKVITLYDDEELNNSLIKKGLERAKLFTWEHTAMETLKVYENVYREFYG